MHILKTTQITALIKNSERNSWSGIYIDSDLLWQSDQKSLILKSEICCDMGNCDCWQQSWAEMYANG